MEENKDIVYLRHVLEAIQTIEEYLDGFNYETFLKDKKTVDATVRELEIIGEASNNLSQKFKDSNPEIPFRDITDMRNVLIHEYFGVNTKIVWDTCQNDLPKLKEVIKATLQ